MRVTGGKRRDSEKGPDTTPSIPKGKRGEIFRDYEGRCFLEARRRGREDARDNEGHEKGGDPNWVGGEHAVRISRRVPGGKKGKRRKKKQET